jgi:hypothetical protein
LTCAEQLALCVLIAARFRRGKNHVVSRRGEHI